MKMTMPQFKGYFLWYWFLMMPLLAVGNTDLELNLTVDNPNFEIYQNVNYTLTVSNTSAVAATDVQINFALPYGMVYTSHNASDGQYSLYFETWTLNEIPANSSATLQLVLFTLWESGPITAYSQVVVAQPADVDSTPGNGTCCTPVEDDEAAITITPGITSVTDLDLDMSIPSGSQIFDGGPITVRIRNNGPAIATNLDIRFTSTVNSVFVNSVTVNQGNTDIQPATAIAGENNWSVGTLPIGAEAIMVLDAVPIDQYNTAYIFAQVQSVDQSDPDSTPGNDTVIPNSPDEDDEDRIIYRGAGGPPGDLELSKTVSHPFASVGDMVTFTITVNNVPSGVGYYPVNNVTVEDVLPPGVQFVSSVASHGLYNQFTGIWNVGYVAETTLPNIHQISPTVSLDIMAVVQSGYPNIVNFAQVETGFDIDSTPGNGTCCTPQEDDEDVATITVAGTGEADLSVQMLIPSGATIFDGGPLTVQVTNNGPGLATNVVVGLTSTTNSVQVYGVILSQGNTDLNTGFINGENSWWVGTLNSGATATMEIDLFRIDQYHTAYIFAQVQSVDQVDPDSTPGNDVIIPNNPDEDDEGRIIFYGIGGVPGDLELHKSADMASANVGDLVTFTIDVDNTESYLGFHPVSDVSVKDILPPGLSFVSATASRGTFDPGSGIWTIGYLAETTLPNAPELVIGASLQLVTMVESGYPVITNFAQVETGFDIDSNPGNDTDNTPDEDDEDDATITVGTNNNLTDLELSLTTSSGTYSLYENVIYTATVSNTSAVLAEHVKVNFPLPPGMVFTSAYASQGNYSLWFEEWIIGSLNPGQSVSLELTLFTLSDAAPITAFAQISAATPGDEDSTPGNDFDQNPDEDDEAAVTIFPVNGLMPLQTKYTDFILYPNPVRDELFVEFQSERSSSIQLKIVSAEGKIIQHIFLDTTTGWNEIRINVQDLVPGVYWLQFDEKNYPYFDRKFVKH